MSTQYQISSSVTMKPAIWLIHRKRRHPAVARSAATLPREAPSAMRIPISEVRCAAKYAITP